MADRILIRGDTRANLLRTDPILPRREMMLEFDGTSINVKIGNGFANYSQLEYVVYDILSNGIRVAPTSRGIVNLSIPVRTSDIFNDGDGVSIYISESRLLTELAHVAGELTRVEGIALGSRRSFVFDTEEQLFSWVQGDYDRGDGLTVQDLVVGDKLLVTDIKSSDYWWNGSSLQEDRNQKIDLSPYANRTEVISLIDAAVAKKYIKRFNSVTDWSEDEPYTMYVPATEHKLGTEFVTDLYRLSGDTYHKYYGVPSTGWSISVDFYGNITVTAKQPFNGKLVVVGHWITTDDNGENED